MNTYRAEFLFELQAVSREEAIKKIEEQLNLEAPDSHLVCKQSLVWQIDPEQAMAGY